MTVAKPKQADTTRKRVERILEEAKIRDIHQITIAKVRTAIERLRCSVRNPNKKPEEYALLSERSRHHHRRAIKQFCWWLDTEGRLTDPLRKWKLKVVVEERNPRDRLQTDELAKLVQGAGNRGRSSRSWRSSGPGR
jgi:hypothetical protein